MTRRADYLSPSTIQNQTSMTWRSLDSFSHPRESITSERVVKGTIFYHPKIQGRLGGNQRQKGFTLCGRQDTYFLVRVGHNIYGKVFSFEIYTLLTEIYARENRFPKETMSCRKLGHLQLKWTKSGSTSLWRHYVVSMVSMLGIIRCQIQREITRPCEFLLSWN